MSFYVYIISNNKLGTIYIGYTNKLKKRMYRHKKGVGSEFAKSYDLKTVVYYDEFTFPMPDIRREKQLKK